MGMSGDKRKGTCGMSQAGSAKSHAVSSGPKQQDGSLVRIAIAFTAWAERWFPDAFIFVAIAIVVVALAAMLNGASPLAVSRAFGEGFWSLITFTMQMAFVAIGGYVVAVSAPAQRLIRRFAAAPATGIGCRRSFRGRKHACIAAQLGPEPDLRRASGARARGTPGIENGLSRRCCGGISRAWSDLGNGSFLVSSAAPGKRGKPTQIP
jgi:Short chain fatty acid transporter